MSLKYWVILVGGLLTFGQEFSWAYELQISWKGMGTEHPLQSWPLKKLSQFKKVLSREKDPATQSLVGWEGILLNNLMESALSTLPLERRAHVDLLILENESGKQALIPRSFLSKYPLILAFSRDKKDLGEFGPICSVVPWTSKPKVLQEELPVENYFLPRLKRVELTNYHERFGPWLLKRRTDPVAIRGEKLFLQTCLGCHAVGEGPAISAVSRRPFSTHPLVRGGPKLSNRDQRSLTNYLNTYRSENPQL